MGVGRDISSAIVSVRFCFCHFCEYDGLFVSGHASVRGPLYGCLDPVCLVQEKSLTCELVGLLVQPVVLVIPVST